MWIERNTCRCVIYEGSYLYKYFSSCLHWEGITAMTSQYENIICLDFGFHKQKETQPLEKKKGW